MKSLKQRAFLICMLVILSLSLTLTASAAYVGDYVVYGGVLIKYTGNETSLAIPGNLGINKIGDTAFAYSCNLTEVTVPEGTTAIGVNAFSDCTSLTTITLPKSLVSIGDEAFMNCDALNAITLPQNVTTVGNKAFYNCNELAALAFEGGISKINDFAFAFCGNLSSVTIPDSVTTIGNYAFSGCTRLTSMIIPAHVQVIEKTAFLWSGNITLIGAEGAYVQKHALTNDLQFSTPGAVSNLHLAQPNTATVLINGKPVSFEAYNIGGNNYFKLRDLALALKNTEKQFEVMWDDAKRAITLTRLTPYTALGSELTFDGYLVPRAMVFSEPIFYLNGNLLSITSYNIAGNNYFKLRSIAAILDFSVVWENSTRTIGVTTASA